jgi:hypothetical protein
MDEPIPRRSIALCAGLTLSLEPSGSGWVLQAGADAVVVLHQLPGTAETADGRWWIENPRGAVVRALRTEGGDLLGSYEPALIDGTVRLVDGPRYALRPPGLRSAVRLRRARGRRTLATLDRDKGRVRITDAGAAEPEFTLVVVLALQALLVEERLPAYHGGGGGG